MGPRSDISLGRPADPEVEIESRNQGSEKVMCWQEWFTGRGPLLGDVVRGVLATMRMESE